MPVPQPSRRPRPPWWLRAYLLVGAAQGLAIGVTGLADPAHVVGFPLATTPLNTRFVAAFYLAGAVGLLASAGARRTVDARVFVIGFVAVTVMLLAATVWYWSAYADGGVPYTWVGSYGLELVAGLAILRALRLGQPSAGRRHRLSPVFLAESAVFGAVGVVLAVSPHLGARMWPWELEPVLARTYAAIFLAFALAALVAAREARPQAVRGFALASFVLVAATAAVSAFHHAKLDGGPSTWVFAAALAAGAAGFGLATAVTLRAETL